MVASLTRKAATSQRPPFSLTQILRLNETTGTNISNNPRKTTISVDYLKFNFRYLLESVLYQLCYVVICCGLPCLTHPLAPVFVAVVDHREGNVPGLSGLCIINFKGRCHLCLRQNLITGKGFEYHNVVVGAVDLRPGLYPCNSACAFRKPCSIDNVVVAFLAKPSGRPLNGSY